MKDVYKGKALWLGPDSQLEGLVHGKLYIVDVKKMKNGKIRVDLESDIYGLKVKHMTCKDAEDFDSKFILKPERKCKRTVRKNG